MPCEGWGAIWLWPGGSGVSPRQTLAGEAGIRTATHQLVTVGRRGVAVITRFDRAGTQRIPFISAASLLGLPPDNAGAYLGIDGIGGLLVGGASLNYEEFADIVKASQR